jgi:transposase InsO family protein
MGNRSNRNTPRDPLWEIGNQWIITAVDFATNWPIAEALKNARQETIADFLHRRIFTQYGCPREILTDNGSQFISQAVEYYLQQLNTKHKITTPFYPYELFERMLTKLLMGKPRRL